MKYVVNGVEYTDLKEAEKAELALQEAEQEKAKLAEVRKADVSVVQNAANAYTKLVAENNKKRDELKEAEQAAYDAYKNALREFAAKHNGYHLTYTNKDGNLEYQVEEIKTKTTEDLMREQKEAFKQFYSYFNDFFRF